MNYLPDIYSEFTRLFPDIAEDYNKLAERCHEQGPLDEKTRRLVKLGIAIGLGSEGAVRSHARRALQENISADELRHVVLLTLSTVGFPNMIAGLKWVEEVIKKAPK